MKKKTIVILGGPTASGKSKLALDLAEACNGVIINGDSLQVYKGFDLLTAKPSQEDQDRVPHRLYGFLENSETCTAARWQKLALEEIRTCQNHLPIVVGGTGLYLDTLIKGLSKIPAIDPGIRKQARHDYTTLGAKAFHERLSVVDSDLADRVPPTDRQRCIRAWEVYQQTGKPLTQWQKIRETEAISFLKSIVIVLDPPRDELTVRAEKRFLAMLDQGVLREVESLLGEESPPSQTLLKAIGYRELKDHLQGAITLEEATNLALIATRQYIKRQSTWFRNQFKATVVMDHCYKPSTCQEDLRVLTKMIKKEIKS